MSYSRAAYVLVVLASLAGQTWAAGVVDPTADIQAQYEAVLGMLKRPGASGVLVSEILPESAAGGSGLRGGDIITSYASRPITTLQSLREAVAEAVARRIEEQDRSEVNLRVRRPVSGAAGKMEEMLITVPRLPLEVEAGISGPRNPPPSARGLITMHWQELQESLRTDGEIIGMRVQERAPAIEAAATRKADASTDSVVGEIWLGWQRFRVVFSSLDHMNATLEMAQIDPAEETVKVMEHASFSFEFDVGDYSNLPAFMLQSLQAEYTGAASMRIRTTANRLGESLRVETTKQLENEQPGPVEKRSAPAPIATIVQPALPLVAAALPHQPNAVLGVQLLSVRDYIPRPGYVLATAGKQLLPSDGQGTDFGKGWRVDLMYCGVAVESYWYSDNYRLLCVQANAGRPEVSRRVQNPADAELPAERKPATQPATNR